MIAIMMDIKCCVVSRLTETGITMDANLSK
nr:MAG TPA_asm: hypothetical protein [Caudoviricetes sp.]